MPAGHSCANTEGANTANANTNVAAIDRAANNNPLKVYSFGSWCGLGSTCTFLSPGIRM